jgi:hypothetical protein
MLPKTNPEAAALAAASVRSPWEAVEITNRRHHETALSIGDAHMLGETIAFAARTVAIENDRALAVEVRGRLVSVQWA